MHIHPKLRLRYGLVRNTNDGQCVGAHHFEHRGFSVWDPYAGIGNDGDVDPRTYYGITLEQANQLCSLNGINLPPGFVV